MVVDLYSDELREKIGEFRANGDSIAMLSGGFAPLHSGHLSMMRETKERYPNHKLVVVVNCNNFLVKKKGFLFSPEDERAAIVNDIKYVDLVVVYDTESMFVHEAIREIAPDVFCNGGDRSDESRLPQEELDAIKETGCEAVFGVGGSYKANSASWLVEDRFVVPDLLFSSNGHPAKTESHRMHVMCLAEGLAKLLKMNLWTMNYYSEDCRIGLK